MSEQPIVAGNNALAPEPETPEKALGSETAAIVEVAAGTVIATQDDYEAAANILKEVKRLQKKVKEYWEPLRASAKQAYDGVLEKKKQMTEPLDKAEAALKGAMTTYTVELERKRREQEEAMREAARQEADRMLEAAAAAEAAGDKDGAAAAMDEAEIMEGMASTGRVIASSPKASGISQAKTWKITEIDPEKVPIKVGVTEIRPVDQAAIMRLIKESKGTVQIPGVKYEESVNISVRA